MITKFKDFVSVHDLGRVDREICGIINKQCKKAMPAINSEEEMEELHERLKNASINGAREISLELEVDRTIEQMRKMNGYGERISRLEKQIESVLNAQKSIWVLLFLSALVIGFVLARIF